MVSIEKVAYFGQPNCYKLSNSEVEVIVTTDIGPRIIAYRFSGGENILAELGPENVVRTPLGDWHPWGGHRLWHAPEAMPRSYSPDNDPIEYEITGTESIRLAQPVEASTGIQKTIQVTLDPRGSSVTVRHELTNKGLWPVELAPWALTIVAGGGTTILPNEPFIPHTGKLTPARPMVLWHYTDLSDPRWVFGPKFIRLKCDRRFEHPQKIGVGNRQGWGAYLREDVLFVKRVTVLEGATYPDFGCNFETYTAGDFMELESLGPMTTLEPDETAEHTERWHLFKGVRDVESDDALEATITPLVMGTEA